MGKVVGTIFLAVGLACIYAAGRLPVENLFDNEPLRFGRRSPPNGAVQARPTPLIHLKSSASNVVEQVHDLAAALDFPVASTADLNQRVESFARSLTIAHAGRLVSVARSPAASHHARYLAVYFLARRPAVFRRALETLAHDPGVKEASEPHRHFEQILRAQALVALDQLNRRDRREESFFRNLEATTRDPFVRKLAGLGARGAERGQALIHEYLDVKL